MAECDLANNLIILDPRTSKRTQRCSIVHEMIHWERQDSMGCVPWLNVKAEHAVQMETARRLVDLRELRDALAWANDLPSVADYLDVDECVVLDRVRCLTGTECSFLDEALECVEGVRPWVLESV